MEFGYLLNDYLHRLNCTAKALADASGVSPIQLSRWRNGSRRPSDEMLRRLAAGIARMSDGALEEKEILDSMLDTLPETRRGGNGFGMRLDQLLKALRIRSSEVSRVLNFDPSYLSRIRAGKRNPTNVAPMIDSVSRYIARRCTSGEERSTVAEVIGTNAAALEDAEDYRSALSGWLRSGTALPAPVSKDIAAFLEALGSFDLTEFVGGHRNGADRERLAPQQLPKARTVTGIKNLLRCDLAFFRATELSDSTERVLVYSDMPVMLLTKDPERTKQWMEAVARLARKGLEIVVIYNLDRSLEETIQMLGFTIPLFMTGRVQPYCLREGIKGPFRHLLKVSGAAALSGEAIAGHYDESAFHLTYDAAKMSYFRRRAEALLERSVPLVEIYAEERQEALRRFLDDEAENGFLPVQIRIAAFRNITVQVCHDRWAIITKENAPRVSFLSRIPQMIDALERFNMR